MSDSPSKAAPSMSSANQYYALMKPRVIQLIVFCALIGMVLAVPGVPTMGEIAFLLCR